MERRPYPSDIDEDTDHFMVPYLVLKPEHAGQRKYPLKDGLCCLNLALGKRRAGVI